MISLRKRSNEGVWSLRDIDLFSGCNRIELRRIGSLMTLIEMEQGRVLIEEGRVGLEFFVVKEGTATASHDGMWLAEFGPGSFFGELALLDRSLRTATVIASTDMSLFVFSCTEFCSLQGTAPSVVHKMSVELSRRLRYTYQSVDQESVCAPSPRRGITPGGTWHHGSINVSDRYAQTGSVLKANRGNPALSYSGGRKS